ncbi:MAG: NAD-dependent dehydratase [Myxococcales bacterium]|nr:NAD-dependent dehydratase [Myxococcales bacterium]|tara:strand:- start:818 stop:1762 length:945 start_codon:yes stop_codon:yes gene_type:complete
MPTVVITGAAGFLGSHLCDRFLNDGYRVIGMDNLITGSPDNIEHLLGTPEFRFVNQDVTEFIYVSEPVDVVLHFASPASPPDYLKHPIKTLKVGALGTHKTLGLAKAKGAKFLLASTSEVYGDPQVHPQREDYWGHVNPTGPRGVYDEAKRYAEALTMAYNRAHGVDTRIIRIFNTYGPRMRLNDGRVVPNFIYQLLTGNPISIYGDGEQTRSFCYVADLVEAIVRVVNQDEIDPFNLGNPVEISMLELAQTMAKMAGTECQFVYKDLPVDDPKRRQPDISRAKEVLGWVPGVSLEEGMRETFAYFKDRMPVTP